MRILTCPSIALGLFACALLAGCGGGTVSESEGAADPDAAAAAVERVQRQKPPPQPISLQPILRGDIEEADLYGAGCKFAPGRSGAEPVIVTRSHEAYMKLSGEILILAPDTGGSRWPLHTWARYDGLAQSIEMTMAAERPLPPEGEGSAWPGHLTVRDEFGQPVYQTDGIVRCAG